MDSIENSITDSYSNNIIKFFSSKNILGEIYECRKFVVEVLFRGNSERLNYKLPTRNAEAPGGSLSRRRQRKIPAGTSEELKANSETAARS